MKRESVPVGSAAEVSSSKSFWSLQSQADSSEFAMNFGRPVPCEQGAADRGGGAPDADPPFGSPFCDLFRIHLLIDFGMFFSSTFDPFEIPCLMIFYFSRISFSSIDSALIFHRFGDGFYIMLDVFFIPFPFAYATC